jgi:PKD repeat protein
LKSGEDRRDIRGILILLALFLILITLIIIPVSAITWIPTNGCWTAINGNNTYIMWNATGNTTWNIPAGVTTVEYLVVGGGGSGGYSVGGGGGGGGFLNGTSLEVSGTVNISVGAGGALQTVGGLKYNGQNSTFHTITATGGGYGGYSSNGGTGGSGGGAGGAASSTLSGGTGNIGNYSPVEGYAGGNTNGGNGGGAGGGGASGKGSDVSSWVGGNGGNGIYSSITGENIPYSGGGGGGSRDYSSSAGGVGGIGGGGNGGGSNTPGYDATAGINGTGGGGGAGTNHGLGGKMGGSGVVIIQFNNDAIETPVSSFTNNVTSGYYPLAVQLNDTSTNTPIRWIWNITNVTGNNTPITISTSQNITYIFPIGNWSVTLTAINYGRPNITNGSQFVNVSFNPSLIFSPWVYSNGCWTSYNDTVINVMWNATGKTSWTIPDRITNVNYLVVAGGGGGGGNRGGGGGAGGMLTGNYTVSPGTNVIIAVGSGGAGGYYNNYGIDGSNSSFANTTVGDGVNAKGGGGGGFNNAAGGASSGHNGGSGGGGARGGTGGLGVPGQGNNGSGSAGFGGSGGGAGAASVGIGPGGNGRTSSITGVDTYYAGGGASLRKSAVPYAGGLGGGASGAYGINGEINPTSPGVPGTGGGGGAGGDYQYVTPQGSAGGSGIVILQYTPEIPIVSFTTNNTEGYAPITIQFNDTSENNPTSWEWNFTNVTGNNTPVTFSISQNITQIFGIGNFSISLNVTNVAGSNISTPIWINTSARAPAPVANFSSTNATGGYAPLYVVFNDTSTNYPTSWEWNITNVTGNNTPITISTSQNTTMIFDIGNWSVQLNTSNIVGSNTTSYFINVTRDPKFFSQWVYSNGCWTSYNDTMINVMWNATGKITWTIPDRITEVNYLVVAGGGGGGGNRGGGGGAGGMLTGNYTVSPGTNVIIAVGSGGAGGYYNNYGTDGSNSSFANTTVGNGINAKGGGAGAYNMAGGSALAGHNGGSGGGGGRGGAGGIGVAGQGNNGYPDGGGGGAGASAVNSTGGIGRQSAITGTLTYYAGGGAGNTPSSTQAQGGLGGGAAGGWGPYTNSHNPTDPGVPGTGGGGGGGGDYEYLNPQGTGGGSGIVIIQYTPVPPQIPIVSFTINNTSGYAPYYVLLNDTSTNYPTSWVWNITNVTGNNTPVTISTLQNVTYPFPIGNWSVTLTAITSAGENSTTNATLINVSFNPAFFTPWEYNENGYWTSYNDTMTDIMWNATGGTTWTVMGGITSVNYLVVAGGGAGGNSLTSYSGAGGGGAGGVLYGLDYAVTAGTDLNVVVGSGGVSSSSPSIGANGGNSSFANTTLLDGIQARGGGGGGAGGVSSNGQPGGSGGGGGYSSGTAGTGTTGQGNAGAAFQSPNDGGGGGGKGETATTALGANGTVYTINGSQIYYAGGGGGGRAFAASRGGLGGGGAGAFNSTTAPTNGIANTGGGGGGSYGGFFSSGAGGSGVVIVQFLTPTTVVANFKANNTISNTYPMVVQFNDSSSGNPIYWNWSFGDGRWYNGTNSSAKNPVYTYAVAGRYTVQLSVTNASYQSGDITKNDFINLTSDVDSGVVSWMHMNQSLTPFQDLTGLTWTVNNATIGASPTKFGNGVGDFTAEGSSIYRQSYATLNFSANDFTIELWAYPTGHTPLAPLVTRANQSLSNGWGLINTDGNANHYAFYMGTTANITPLFAIPDNQWSHVVVERDNGVINVYINGMLNAKKIGMGGNFDVYNATTQIGYLGPGSSEKWSGYVSEFRISNGTSRWKANFTTPYDAYKGNLYPLYPDINLNSTFRFKTDPAAYPVAYINNLTTGSRNRTLQIQNVNNATYIAGSITFNPLYLRATAVVPNRTTYNNIQLVSSSIDNNTGVIQFNVTRTGGFAPGTTRTSVVDWNMIYYNYSANDTQDSPFFTYGRLINGSIGWTYPIYNFIGTNLTYGEWNLTSNFTSNVTSVQKGGYAKFTDDSYLHGAMPNSWNWSFGDGAVDSTNSSSPVHQYTTQGLMNVTLTVYMWQNSSIINTTTFTNYINVTDVAPVANFTQNVTSGVFPVTVEFLDNSTTGGEALYWNWSFGDGNYADSRNTTHTYNTGGNFTVNLSVINSGGLSYKRGYVNVYNTTVTGFTANITAGLEPSAIKFNVTTPKDNATFWNWSFGDGIWQNGTSQNVTHLYGTGGIYTVTEISNNLYANNTTTIIDYITIYSKTTSNITSNVTSGYASLAVQFTGAGENATIWNWSFGDGNYSDEQSPIYIYPDVGVYTINFSTSNGHWTNWTNLTDYINAYYLPTPTADFNANVTGGLFPLVVGFIDASTGIEINYWNYSFGDGQYSDEQNPVHIYASGGTYTVIQTVANAGSSNTSTRTNYIIVDNSTVVGFEANVTDGLAPMAVKFNVTLPHDNATFWNWSFGDGAWQNGTTQNVTHVYGNGGLYTVTEYASNPNATNIVTYSDYISVHNRTISGFSGNKTFGLFPLAVSFNVTIPNDNATMWNWSFGDGNFQNSTELQNASYVYGNGGRYTVTLTTSNTYASNTTTLTNYIEVYNSTVTGFTANVTEGSFPLTVMFNVTTPIDNATSWNWSFGDGDYANTQNATHTYNVAGNYTVSETANNTHATNTTTIVDYIQIYTGVPVVDFTSNKTTASTYPMVVQFNDSSAGAPSMWNWSFGDGRWYNGTNISAKNPVYTYAVAGSYDVSLWASNNGGANSTNKTGYITLQSDVDSYVFSWMHMGTTDDYAFQDHGGLTWVVSNATINSTHGYFGNGSGDFTGYQAYLGNTLPVALLNSKNFTVEGWVYPLSVSAGSQIISNAPNASYRSGWGLINPSGTENGYVFYMGNSSVNSTSAFTIPNNQWTHVVIERKIGTIYVYINGQLVTTKTGLGGTFDTSSTVSIGYMPYGGATSQFNGHLQETRMSIGFAPIAARWNANFTTPYSMYRGELMPLYPDINPDSTLKFDLPVISIANQTNGGVTYRTINIKNVTNATYVVGSTSYDAKHGYVSTVIPNTSYYNNIQVVSYTVDKVNGIVLFNLTRPGGFSAGTNDISIADIPVLYWNYTDAPNYTSIYNYGYLINGTTHITYPFNYFDDRVTIIEPWVLIPNFTVNATRVYINSYVSVTDDSSSYGAYPNIWNWSWGDGNFTNGTAKTVIFKYTVPGVYDLYDNISIWQNRSVFNVTNKTITVLNDPPIIDFTSNVTYGAYPLAVNFTDSSSGVELAWNWSFGDGNYADTRNSTHIYNAGGKYSVTYNVTNDGGFNKTTKINYITVYNQTLTGFTANKTSGIFPFTARFNVTTPKDNATWWNWSFGDGLWQNGTSQNVTHTYGTSGVYTVTEYASNPYWTNSTTLTDYITVNAQTVSGFSANNTVGLFPLAVQFNTTVVDDNGTYWNWSFDGGKVWLNASTQNVSYVFGNGGTYTIIRTVQNPLGGYNQTILTDYITVYNRTTSGFIGTPRTGVFPLTVQFNTSVVNDNGTMWNYSFDGGYTWQNTSAQNTSHTFASGGNYTIYRSVQNTHGGYNLTILPDYITIYNRTSSIFVSNVTEGYIPLAVNFTGSGSNATRYNWSFGDGTYSDLQTPEHVYEVLGNYTINFSASNDYWTNWTNVTEYIHAYSVPIPATEFNGTPTEGLYPLGVQFVDMSNAPLVQSWNWSFGDGQYSNMQNASHIYYTGGSYTVSLNITNIGGSNTNTKNYYITVYNKTTSKITSNVTTGNAPLTVQFTGVHTNGTIFYWLFGDGSNATILNPVHTYVDVGNYTVNFSVSNGHWTNWTNWTDYIRAALVPAPNTNFTSNVTTGLFPTAIQFTDTTTGEDLLQWNWSFGDDTYSTNKNPIHIYTRGGNFTVSLIATNRGGDTTLTVPDYITIYNTTSSGFSANTTTAGTYPLAVQFNTTVVNDNGTTWNWSFNGGVDWDNESTQNITHIFDSGGSFTIIRVVQNEHGGYSATTRTNYITVYNQTTSNFTSNATSGLVPLAIQFNGSGTNGSLYLWIFGDGYTSSEQNPVHTYRDVGTFSVNFSVTNPYYTNWTNVSDYITANAIEPPITNFTNLTPLSGINPVTITFIEDSTGYTIESWNWSFGDGNWQNGTTHNATHTYRSGGNYTVSLTTTNLGGSNTSTKVDYVTIYNQTTSNFYANTTFGVFPLTVQFNSSVINDNGTMWNWSFGDGNYADTQNATHTYNTGSNYTITRIVQNEHGGYSSTTKYQYVDVKNQTRTGFTANITDGLYPLTVMFNVTTPKDNATSWNWSFGDGNYANTQNATHTYMTGGNFTVSQTARSLFTTNTTTVSDFITVYNHTTSTFTSNETEGYAPLAIQFNGYGQNSSSYYWMFGDGNTSTEQNPVHIFSDVRLYNINFSTSNGHWTNWTNISYYITAFAAPLPSAAFNATPTSGLFPLEVTFMDNSTVPGGAGSIYMWNWSFGDGQYSNNQHPVHTYANGGCYTVIENVTNSGGSNLSTRDYFITVYNSTQIGFTANVTSGFEPIAIKFTVNNTNDNATFWNWSFGDGTWKNGTVQSPTHVYGLGGVYNVTEYASNYHETNVSTKTNYITIYNKTTNGFTSNISSGYNPLAVQFTGYSTNATAWNWSFGDGNYSEVQSPLYVYKYPGSYTVTFSATNGYWTNTSTRYGYISVTQAPIPIVNFVGTPLSGSVGLTVTFNDLSTRNPTAWNWSFGDGYYSESRNTTHTYTAGGNYTVTLNASNPYGYNETTKVNYIYINDQLPTAYFSANSTSGYPPLAVQFVDATIGFPISWNWSFGDGNYSTEQNPVHIYVNPGTYTVIDNATNVVGYNTSTRTNYITVTTLPIPESNFTASPTSTTIGDTIAFTDYSTNLPNQWNWSFGDGNYSNEQNPTYVYNSPGTYTISLNATNGYGSNTKTRTNYVSIVAYTPVADFGANQTAGYPPLTVSFTDQTTNVPTWWNWTFNDGSYSDAQNPTHTFASAGTYSITLKVSNSGGSDQITKSGYIVVAELPVPVTNFTADPLSGYNGTTVTFTDTSTNSPIEWNWSFGDGNYSSEQSPTHTYDVIGKFNVRLNATNTYGSNTKTRTNYITINPKIPITAFNGTPLSGTYPLTVTFSDTINGLAVTSYNYSFGDGTFSNIRNATHIYRTGGTFTVNFTATNAGGSNTTSRTDYITVYNQSSSNITSNVTTGIVPVAVQFNGSGSNVTGYYWMFGDGNTSTEQNPVYTYTSSGRYTINFSTVNGVNWTNWTNLSYYITANVVPAPVSDFTSNVTSGLFPLTVQFNDTSSGNATSWNWLFGDGGYSTERNVTHTYWSGGNYTVSLNTANAGGSNISTKTNYISVYNTTISGFTANSTFGVAPYTIKFNVTAPKDNATSWNWSFGDGTWQNGTTQNGTHTYTVAGTYTVTEYANNPYATNSTTITDYITIIVKPKPSFTANITTGYEMLTVQFTDTSVTDITTWNWTFGNGAYNVSTLQNPVYTFVGPGYYNVTLNVTNASGFNATTYVNYINVLSLPGPVANFTSNVTSGYQALAVKFTDTSTNTPVQWNWSFGDGNYSNEQNPVHVYNAIGNFTVTLDAANSHGYSIKTKTDYIRVNPAPIPYAEFSATPRNGTIYTMVQFTDLTNNTPTSWNWSFGDGNYSELQNPNHTYIVAGVYSISLNTTNQYGSVTTTKVDYINMTVQPPVGGFSATPLVGYPPLSVQFIDSSHNATSWYWEFGDGYTSTLQNPSHNYTNVGVYNVKQTVYNAGGSNITIKNGYITVSSTPLPSANFVGSPTSGDTGMTVQFTDLSTGSPTVWNWSFGDGNYSNDQNPNHTYNVAGVFTVRLIATNVYGSSTATRTNYITVSVKLPVAAFSANQTAGYPPLAVEFTDASTGSPTNYNWSFGDGTYSTAQNPVNIYTSMGNYTVMLTVSNEYGSNKTIKANYINVGSYPVPGTNFNGTPRSGYLGTNVQFNDLSTVSPTSWNWSFGDGNYSNEQNPNHTYNVAGLFTISLNATNSYGSNSNTKVGYINIIAPVPIAQFVANTTVGAPPFAILFTDQSYNLPTSWNWSFGDGNYSNEQSPVHWYNKTGIFTVSLTATNAYGSNTSTRINYITTVVGQNRQDLNLTPQFRLIAKFTDPSGRVIPIVTVFDSAGNTTVTSNGTFVGYYPYGMVTITTSASGYGSITQTYTMDYNRLVNITLSPSTSTNATQLVVTKTVRFVCQNYNGEAIAGMNTTVYAVGSTIPLSWVTTLFGINLGTTPLLNTTMNGSTGTDGSIVYVMVPTSQYAIHFEDVEMGINETRYYYPQENEYVETFFTQPVTYGKQGIATDFYTYRDQTNGTITLGALYNDTYSSTDNLTFTVMDKNKTIIYQTKVTPT